MTLVFIGRYPSEKGAAMEPGYPLMTMTLKIFGGSIAAYCLQKYVASSLMVSHGHACTHRTLEV